MFLCVHVVCLFVPLIVVVYITIVNNLISDCGTPVVWGELVPSKIFNPSALTLKVGQLVMCYYNITFDGLYFSFTLELYIRIITPFAARVQQGVE